MEQQIQPTQRSSVRARKSQFIQLMYKLVGRCYLLLRLRTAKNKKVLVWLALIVQIAQFLSIIFPYENDMKLPWNYNEYESIWKLINIIFRLDVLLKVMGFNQLKIFLFFSSVYGLLLLQRVVMLILLYNYSEVKFKRVLEQPNNYWNWTLIIDSFICNFNLKIALIPTIKVLLNGLTNYNEEMDVLYEQVPKVIVAIFLSVVFIWSYLEVIFKINLQWGFDNVGSIQCCEKFLSIFTNQLAIVVITSIVPYHTQPAMYSFSLIVLGGYYFYNLFSEIPFYHRITNFLYLVNSANITWAGVLLSFQLLMNLHGNTITILYILQMPMIIFLLWVYMNKQVISLQSQTQFKSVYTVEQVIRYYSFENPEQLLLDVRIQKRYDILFQKALKKYKNSVILIIWAVQYYQQIGERNFLKVLFSQLNLLKNNILYFVTIESLIQSSMEQLRIHKDEHEIDEFINYITQIDKAIQLDLESCIDFIELTSLVCQKNINFDLLHQRVYQLGYHFQHCKQQYQLINQLVEAYFPSQCYGTFLQCFGHVQEAQVILQLSQLNQHRDQQLRQSFKLTDAKNIVIIAKLGKQSHQRIIWDQSAQLLGYSQGELLDQPLDVLVPPPIQLYHSSYVERSIKNRHQHPIYEGSHMLFVLNKKDFLVQVQSKIRVANLPTSGEVVSIACLQIKQNPLDVAFVNDQLKIVAQTENFYSIVTQLGIKFAKKVKRLGKYGWKEGALMYKANIGDDQFKFYMQTIKLFDTHNQKIIAYDRQQKNQISEEISYDMDFSTDKFNPSILRNLGTDTFTDTNNEQKFQNRIILQSTEDILDSGVEIDSDMSNKALQHHKINFQKTQKSLRLIKRVMLTLITMYTIFWVAITRYWAVKYANDNQQYQDGIDYLQDISKLRKISSQLAFYTKMQYLNSHNAFYLTYDKIQEEYQQFTQVIQQVKETNKESLILVHNDNFQYLTFQEDYQQEFKQLPLFEIIKLTQLSIQALTLFDYSTNLDKNTEFLTLYSNSPSWGMDAFNDTTFQIAKSVSDARQQSTDIDFILFVQLTPIVSFTFLLILLPILLKVNYTRKQIWNRFLQIPYNQLLAQRNKVLSRLSEFHEYYIDTEKIKKQSNTITQYRMSKRFFTLNVIVILFFLLTSLSSLSLQYFLTGNLDEEMRNYPQHLNMAEMRQSHIALSNFWLLENSLEHLGKDTRWQILKKQNRWNNSKNALIEQLRQLRYISQNYIIRRIPLDSQLEKMLYQNASFEDNSQNLIDFGLMAAILEYEQRAQDISTSQLDYEESGCYKLWEDSEYIQNSVDKSNKIIQENAEELQIQASTLMQNVLVGITCVSMLVFIIGVTKGLGSAYEEIRLELKTFKFFC